jgi:hypothetical protein
LNNDHVEHVAPQTQLRGDIQAASGEQVPAVESRSTHPMALRSRKANFVQAFNISVKQALKIMPEEAHASMMKELTQLHEKSVFKPALASVKPVKKKVIKSFMFLKDEYFSDGTFDKLKSRLVAGGHMQDRSDILCEDITSPTANQSHLMVVAAIAVKEGRKVKTVDISGAYLNADMAHVGVVMELDKVLTDLLVAIDPRYQEFVRKDGTMIVELQNALCGCIESAKLWYDLLSETLTRDGFIKNPLDPCVFNKMVSGLQITVVVYVDDIFIASLSDIARDELVNLLRAKFKDITVNEGLVHSYLGITWDFFTPFAVKVRMDGYTDDLLELSGVTGVVKTPATDQLFMTRETSPLDAEGRDRLHSLVAKLLYLAKRTRPDILLPMIKLQPNRRHTNAESIFGWAFMALSWNLVARSVNISEIMLEHIQWKGDCMCITVPKHKGDQTGEGGSREKHIFANPLQPEVCPFLSLALYTFFMDTRHINDHRLFVGSKQEARFSKILRNMLAIVPNVDAVIRAIEDIGTHSNRKGAASYLCSIDEVYVLAVYLRVGKQELYRLFLRTEICVLP